MKEEVFRPVVGYEGLYEVSDLGRVFSLLERNGVSTRERRRELRPQFRRRALKVDLCRNGVISQRSVHSIVAEAFIGIRPTGAHVNHRSGDTGDNRLVNLEYATAKENEQHAVVNHLKANGERHGLATLSDAEVAELRIAVREGRMTRKQAAEVYGISYTTAKRMASGKTRAAPTVPHPGLRENQSGRSATVWGKR